jgi:hypothetical protein
MAVNAYECIPNLVYVASLEEPILNILITTTLLCMHPCIVLALVMAPKKRRAIEPGTYTLPVALLARGSEMRMLFG